MAIVGGIVTLYGTVVSTRQRAKDASEQRKARRLRQKQSDISAARARSATIREARIKRAQVQSAAQEQGAAESSGVVGGLASLQTQTATQVGNIFQTQAAGAAITSRLDAAGRATERVGEAQAVSQIGMTIFSNSERISSIFK